MNAFKKLQYRTMANFFRGAMVLHPFNPDENWCVEIFMAWTRHPTVMISENYRERVELFMSCAEVKSGLQKLNCESNFKMTLVLEQFILAQTPAANPIPVVDNNLVGANFFYFELKCIAKTNSAFSPNSLQCLTEFLTIKICTWWKKISNSLIRYWLPFIGKMLGL